MKKWPLALVVLAAGALTAGILNSFINSVVVEDNPAADVLDGYAQFGRLAIMLLAAALIIICILAVRSYWRKK